MKRTKNLLGRIFLMASLMVVGAASVQALTVVPKTLKGLVQDCGKASVWIQGEITNAKTVVNPVGWTVTRVEITGTQINRPETEANKNLSLNEAAPASQTFSFDMVGSPARQVIPGLGTLPPVGTQGIFGIHGVSSKGLTSFCGTQMQGVFRADGQGNVSNDTGNKFLELQQIKLDGVKNARAGKALENLKAYSPGAALPVQELKAVIADLYQERWGQTTP